MPTYSLSRMFASITLIAVGLGVLLLMFRAARPISPAVFFPVWFGSGTFIGAGVFNFFKRPIVGAIVGFVLQLVLLDTLSEPRDG